MLLYVSPRATASARRLALLALFVAETALAQPPDEPRPTAALPPSVERWTRLHAAPPGSASPSEIDEALRALTFREVCEACRSAPFADSLLVRSLGELVRARAALEDSMVVLRPILTDIRTAPACYEAALAVARARKDGASARERAIVADALLVRSNQARSPAVRQDMEVAAAAFATTEKVFGRVRAYLAAGADLTRLQGVAMAEASDDPRVAVLVLQQLERVEAAPGVHRSSFVKTFAVAARSNGPRALEALERIYREDHATVRDSTAALPPGSVRDLHEAMHEAVCRLHATLAAALRSGSPGDARVAFDLVDRASRFGDMSEPREMGEALDAFSQRKLVPGEDVRRVLLRVRGARSCSEPGH